MTRRSTLLLILLSTLYLGASAFVIEYFAHLYQQQEFVEEQLYLRKQSALLRAKLETTLNQELFAAESLVVIANINREFTAQHWQHIAAIGGALAVNSQYCLSTRKHSAICLSLRRQPKGPGL